MEMPIATGRGVGTQARAGETPRRALVGINKVEPTVVASSPAGSHHNYTLICEEP